MLQSISKSVQLNSPRLYCPMMVANVAPSFFSRKSPVIGNRVAACHALAVFLPVGNRPISVTGVRSMPSLVHETDKAGLICRSGYLSNMERPGGINFMVLRRRGNRKKKQTALLQLVPRSWFWQFPKGSNSLKTDSVESSMVLGSGKRQSGKGGFLSATSLSFPSNSMINKL